MINLQKFCLVAFIGHSIKFLSKKKLKQNAYIFGFTYTIDTLLNMTVLRFFFQSFLHFFWKFLNFKF